MGTNREEGAMSETKINGVLVAFSYGCIAGSKKDAEITAEVLQQKGAEENAGTWSNRLFPAKTCGKKNAFTEWRTHLSRMRHWHYTSTYMFEDSVWRILPQKRVESYRQVVQVDGKSMADELMEAFIIALPDLKEKAKLARGTAYKESDYPTAEDIRASYHYSVDFRPIPDASQLNAELMKDAVDKLNALHQQRLREANETLIKRLLEPFKTLSEQLKDPTKRRIAPVIGTILEVTQMIPSMDLSGNNELQQIATMVNATFANITPEMLRKDEAVQKLVGETADQAVTALERFGKVGARAFAD
jgi:hypothetical protein